MRSVDRDAIDREASVRIRLRRLAREHVVEVRAGDGVVATATQDSVVSEPAVKKPVCMTWDERGRLWLCETVDYPNELQPKGKGRDRDN